LHLCKSGYKKTIKNEESNEKLVGYDHEGLPYVYENFPNVRRGKPLQERGISPGTNPRMKAQACYRLPGISDQAKQPTYTLAGSSTLAEEEGLKVWEAWQH
jgi:hypothetical protein